MLTVACLWAGVKRFGSLSEARRFKAGKSVGRTESPITNTERSSGAREVDDNRLRCRELSAPIMG